MEALKNQVLSVEKFIRDWINGNRGCPYASRADLSATVRYVRGESQRANISMIAKQILAHSASQREGFKSDAMAIIFPGEVVSTREEAKEMVSMLLSEIDQINPGSKSLREGKESRDWRLYISGTEYFAAFFGPFYPGDHTRYSGSNDIAWLMLQPGSSFKRMWLKLGILKEQAFAAARRLINKRGLRRPKETLDYEKIVPKVPEGDSS